MASAMHNMVEILLVEDNEFDVEAVRRAFRKAEISNRVHNAIDGVDALGKLRGAVGAEGPLHKPLLILLDINMPRMDGFGVIEGVRADPNHRATPVLVLTTESDADKKARARAAGATGWIVKPFDPAKLVDAVRRVAA